MQSIYKKIIIIGHTGQLGSAVFDRLKNSYNVLVPKDRNCFCLPTADILINCAGKVIFGSVLNLSEEDVEDMLDANIKLAWRASKQFIVNGGKHIINIGSTRSFSTAPFKSIYSATKHAIKALTESIPIDHPTVKSSLICPGNFTNNPLLLNTVVDAVEFAIEHPETKEIICGGQI